MKKRLIILGVTILVIILLVGVFYFNGLTGKIVAEDNSEKLGIWDWFKNLFKGGKIILEEEDDWDFPTGDNEIDNLEIGVARIGYIVPTGSSLEGINLFDSKGRFFRRNNEGWRELTEEVLIGNCMNDINQWCVVGEDVEGKECPDETENCGVLPEDFIARVGYYFPSESEGRINLFGTLEGVEKTMVYNIENEIWYDRSENMNGDYLDENLHQWCNGDKCGVLPNGLIVTAGYHFNSASGGRVNLFGTLNGESKLMIFNPRGSGSSTKGVWFDRSENLNGEVGKLPAGKVPIVGYYYPFSGGKVDVFYEDGGFFTLNFENGRAGGWVDRSNELENNDPPFNKNPLVNYYDFYVDKNVLFFEDAIYTKEAFNPDASFARDDDYLYFKGIPPHEDYINCNPDEFSDEELELVGEFNFDDLDEEDKEWIRENCPWMKPDDLNNCDKIFLINEIMELVINASAMYGC